MPIRAELACRKLIDGTWEQVRESESVNPLIPGEKSEVGGSLDNVSEEGVCALLYKRKSQGHRNSRDLIGSRSPIINMFSMSI